MSEKANPDGKPKLPHPDADYYVLEGNRRALPRATSVIERGIGKPFLTKWAARLERDAVLEEVGRSLACRLEAAQIEAVLKEVRSRLGRDFACEIYRDEAAAFGTATHAIIEDHLRASAHLPRLERLGDLEPPPGATRAASLAIEWLGAIGFEAHDGGIEERLWSEDERLWSAGTVDAFGTANLGGLLANTTWNRKYDVAEATDARVPLLVDWKTSNSVGLSHKVQIGAYLTFLLEQGRLGEACYACILRVARREEDATPLEALLIHPKEFARYGGAFRLLRRMYNFLSQEEDLERSHWRSRRRAARAAG